jgi:ubiquinone/menaquinone biosynthesis C-methylase UbiE
MYPLINWVLPAGLMRTIIRRSHSSFSRSLLKDAGSWESMQMAYDPARAEGLVDRWIKYYGAFPMALRNRRKLCHKTLSGLLKKFPDGANILSIGAGPGSNVLEPVAESAVSTSRVFCIDIDPHAFDLGRKTASALGILDRVEFIEGNALDVGHLVHVQPHVAVMVGILEYLTDEQALGIFRVLREAMPPGGVVMASTLRNYHGIDRFLFRVFDFKLIYRDAAQVGRLLSDAGFADLAAACEPVGIYNTVVGFKRT